MEGALIGLAGLLVGILLNEYYRRNSRIEKYSTQVFEKRLCIYEGLMSEIQLASSIISELIDNNELSVEEKKEAAFHAGFKVPQYIDEHKFYLDEDITVHCCLAFVGTNDIFKDPINEEELKDFRQAVKESYEMIRTESSVAELDGLFRSITKSSPSGRLIEGYRAIKEAHRKRHNKRIKDQPQKHVAWTPS